MPEIALNGLTPTPLARYLAALGTVRLVSEQADREARCRWSAGCLHLSSRLDARALSRFFLDEYRPSPILAPWNGGSGFYRNWNPKKGEFRAREAAQVVAALESSDHPRMAPYARAIGAVRTSLEALSRPFDPQAAPVKELKHHLLFLAADGSCRSLEVAARSELRLRLRALLPDPVIEWLDVTFALAPDAEATFPLLGSGGNDGNLDFSVTFMRRIRAALPLNDGDAVPDGSEAWLAACLDGSPAQLVSDTSGQFNPGASGGPNAGPGTEGRPLNNPWELILAMEGVLLLSGSISRRCEAGTGRATFPFTARFSASGAGGVSGADRGAARGESWLPTWSGAASLRELRALFREGRAQVGRRPARDGLDFARSCATLGVDRGLTGFERYAFLQRYGRMYVAAPLGRFSVRDDPHVHLLDQVDAWADSVRRAAAGGGGTARLQAASHRLDDTLFRFLRRGGRARLADVLAALGAAERAVSESPSARDAVRRPLQGLLSGWLEAADDGRPELELAAALASIYDEAVGSFRRHLEPVVRTKGRWAWRGDETKVDWTKASLELNLIRILERRLIAGAKASARSDREARRPSAPDAGSRSAMREARRRPASLAGKWSATPAHVAAFLRGEVDDDRLADLTWALCAMDWSQVDRNHAAGDASALPREHALLKLVLLGGPVVPPGSKEPVTVPPEPGVVADLCAGRVGNAVQRAWRRLRAEGLRPPGEPRRAGVPHLDFTWPAGRSRRLAAALVFPLSPETLADLLLAPAEED